MPKTLIHWAIKSDWYPDIFEKVAAVHQNMTESAIIQEQ